MQHHAPLISTIVIGLVLAFALGAVAHRLRVSPIAGYLLAGVAVGPFTPGYVADQHLADQLAEIGVILLMFGVGLHFSVKDLMSVRAVAIPGALGQIAVATALGAGLGALLGWPLAGGLVFGLALSVASTVVLLRALQERRAVQTPQGRVAVGWLIVEDLVMVLTLVLLPTLGRLAGQGGGVQWSDLVVPILLTLGKVGAFAAVMFVVGRRVIPMVLHWAAHAGSRELFRLAVLAIALGVAFGAAALFDVSFALGAFFAGMILAESELSQRAAQETLPLRDAFAVLFFVSVGMLFDPGILLRDPAAVAATLAIIVVGKSVAAYAIVRAFRRPHEMAATVSVSLAQIGEFSFILAGLGVTLTLMPERGRDLILAGAILSILLNPLLFAALDRMAGAPVGPSRAPRGPAPPPPGHIVVAGFDRVGRLVGERLAEKRARFVAIDLDDAQLGQVEAMNGRVVLGNAADSAVLDEADVVGARALVVAVPDAFEAGQIVAQARALAPTLRIVAYARSTAERDHLARLGASHIVTAELEVAGALVRAVA